MGLNAVALLATIAIGILLALLMVINVLLFKKVCASNKSKKIKKSLKVTSIIAIITFTLTAIIIFSCAIIDLITNDNKLSSAVSFIGALFYLISQTTVLVVFSLRIDLTFKGTDLAYSKCITKSLYASCICLATTGIVALSCWAIGSWNLVYLAALLWIIVYISLSILLIVLFIHKIEHLMINTSAKSSDNDFSIQSVGSKSVSSLSSGTGSINSDTKTNQVKNEKDNNIAMKSMIDNELFYIVVKNGLLVPFAICSSFICFMLDISVAYILGPDEFHAVAAFWFVLDCLMTSLCIFLLFSFNNDIYSKLCSGIHQKCEKCQRWKIRHSNKIQKIQSKSTSDIQL